MTYKEAIKILEMHRNNDWSCDVCFGIDNPIENGCTDCKEAFDMAIQALKEADRHETDYMIEYLRYEYCYYKCNKETCPIAKNGLCIDHVPMYTYYNCKDDIQKAYDFVMDLESEEE